MPVQYRGIIDEHRAVRTRRSLRRQPHGRDRGARPARRGAVPAADRQRRPAARRRRTRSTRCSVASTGGVVDDIIVHRLGDRALLPLRERQRTSRTDLAWIAEHAGERREVDDRSDDTALLALQGPAAEVILADADAAAARRRCAPLRVRAATVAGDRGALSRTGYTGEDGCELYVPAARRGRAVGALMLAAGRRRGGAPAGLGARDTLRLEAALPLYGTSWTTRRRRSRPGSAGWCSSTRRDFVGRARARCSRAEAGVPRRLVGLEMRSPGIPRQGRACRHDGRSVGTVTSGTKSPTLGKGIALGYVEAPLATRGTALPVEVRGRGRCRVVDRPFYRRVRQEGEDGGVPGDLKYSSEHEWVLVEGKVAIDRHHRLRAERLGDIVFVELPAVGTGHKEAPSASSNRSRACRDVYRPGERHGARGQRDLPESRAGQRGSVRRWLDGQHRDRAPADAERR